MSKILFTSESVTEGHPDKICDQISDAILDAHVAGDPMSRVACETIATTGLVVVMGEISSSAQVDFQKIVRDTIRDVGYNDSKKGFDADTCAVVVAMDQQSTDIAMGVDNCLEGKVTDESLDSIGAGDQGMMFGYATDETPSYMPYPIFLAHGLTLRLTQCRKEKIIPYLLPDGKAQVTLEYHPDGRVKRADAIVVSTQHLDQYNGKEVTWEQIQADVKKEVIEAVIPAELLDEETKLYMNPTGRFVIGGPNGDSGLTGRKLMVDTYGGWSRHGGGAFSGKDCTKVDRSAAYAARYAAKNLVAAGFCKKVEIQLSYAIGVANPTSVRVDTFGTGVRPDEEIADILTKEFDFRPEGIIRMLDLRRPIYRKTSNYGHFGRDDKDFTWEKIDRVEDLKKYL